MDVYEKWITTCIVCILTCICWTGVRYCKISKSPCRINQYSTHLVLVCRVLSLTKYSTPGLSTLHQIPSKMEVNKFCLQWKNCGFAKYLHTNQAKGLCYKGAMGHSLLENALYLLHKFVWHHSLVYSCTCLATCISVQQSMLSYTRAQYISGIFWQAFTLGPLMTDPFCLPCC